MGLTINYRHRTKNLARIKQLINDLKAFAENTGRGFNWGVSEGYLADRRRPDDHPKDRPYKYSFYDKSLTHLASQGWPLTKSIWFEMELKSPLGPEGRDWMGVRWFRVGDWWVVNDWSKPPRPDSDTTEEMVARRVIEEVGVLEYIKNHYFPDFKIDDEFGFHISYDDLPESQKQFWRDVKAGKRPAYRLPGGGYPDFELEYRRKKHHDVRNIFESFGEINKSFAAVEGMLAEAGFGEDQVRRDVKIKRPKPVGVTERSMPVGDRLVVDLHDTINHYRLRRERRRGLNLRPEPPVRRVWVTRRDGVRQRYTKRLKHGRRG